MIEWAVEEIQESSDNDRRNTPWNLLDALVVVLYGAEEFLDVWPQMNADERRSIRLVLGMIVRNKQGVRIHLLHWLRDNSFVLIRVYPRSSAANLK